MRRDFQHLLAAGVLGGGASVPAYETPSYSNAGGTGNRTASVTVTTTLTFVGVISKLVDGVTNSNDVYWNPAIPNTGKEIKFDFGHSVIVNEIKYYEDVSPTVSQGIWKAQLSSDNTIWADIGANFELGNNGFPQTITTLSGNTTPARYYRLLGVSGNTSSSSWENEFEFKIGNPL